jgi:hypothetical protein
LFIDLIFQSAREVHKNLEDRLVVFVIISGDFFNNRNPPACSSTAVLSLVHHAVGQSYAMLPVRAAPLRRPAIYQSIYG